MPAHAPPVRPSTGLCGSRDLERKEEKKVPPVAVRLVFALDIRALGMKGTEALSDVQWLPPLRESELTTRLRRLCDFFLNMLPAVWVEISR